MFRARVFRGRWLASLLLALGGGTAGAEHLVDRQQLEQWADAYYGQAIAEKRSPGITISVVQDGEVILAKGYGYADYGRQVPVDPETSGFVIGSITKTFIATAIGQLLDRGAIRSLDDPANRYLKRVQLPGERGARVTIRHLLTHRAGFEDGSFGMGTRRDTDAPLPLGAAEIEHFLPKIVREPGGPAVYSNFGFSLLGFLIEDVSGERIDTYLREHLWAPLGMHHTSMIYGQVPANLSRPYRFRKDGAPVLQPLGLPHPWIAPAGAIVSTAGDMARYMNAQLFEGRDGGYPLVSEATFRALHTEGFRNVPISIGFALAFWTTTLNGAPTIEHGGGAPGFQSMLVMIPGKRFGFFISAMQGGLAPGESYSTEDAAAGAALVRDPTTGFELRESFIDRFLQRPVEASRGRRIEPAKLVGTYWSLQRPYTNVEALRDAFDPAAVLTVALAGDGQRLLVSGAGPYTQLGDGVFASPTGRNVWLDPYTIDRRQPSHIAFHVDGAGNPSYLVPGIADRAWAPASPLLNPRVVLRGFLAGGTVVLTGVLLFAWPQRRRFANATNYLALCLACGVLVFPAAILWGFAPGDGLGRQLRAGDTTRLWVMVAVANALVVVAAAFWAGTLREWHGAARGAAPAWAYWGRRVHLAAIAMASVAVLTALTFFHCLGLHVPG